MQTICLFKIARRFKVLNRSMVPVQNFVLSMLVLRHFGTSALEEVSMPARSRAMFLLAAERKVVARPW